VTEEAATKTDPRRSGSYAALKVAAELFLREQARPPLRVSFVRPAYILAPRMNDPMGSVGFRLPGKRLLVLGPGQIQRPLITRNILNQAVATLVARPPAEAFEVLLLVDPQSPGRLEYLRHCATLLGRGWRAVSYPRLIWAPIYAAALLARDWRRPSLSRVMRSIRERQLLQTFDPQRTERRLGFSLQDDWRSALG
jgi:nucleoside-diphosphate-sugar epimerase